MVVSIDAKKTSFTIQQGDLHLFTNFKESFTRRQKIKKLLRPIKNAIKWMIRI